MTGKKITRFLALEIFRVFAVFAVVICFATLFGMSYFMNKTDKVALGDGNELSPLINISELPEEFMETYFADYAELAASDNKENILIVDSMTPLEDTFGARAVVSAANNQYFLEYASAEEKDYAFEQISYLPDVAVQENKVYTFDEVPASNLGAGGTTSGGYNSWGIEAMGLDHASELVENYAGKNDVVVAVIDSGLNVDEFNEQFEGKLAGEYNVINPKLGLTDEAGHGSHVAGTIAEGTPSNVKIIPVKVSTYGSMYTTDIVAGIDWVTYYSGASVANMSFGGSVCNQAEYLAVSAMTSKNIIGVAAAGNESTDLASCPASFNNTISISAVDSNKNLAYFSNFGSTIDFAAPGVDILSIGGYMDGTSMAAPHASAAVAIAKSFNKSLTLSDTIDFLKTRVVDIGAKGRDHQYGYGFIDFNGASLCSGSNTICDKFSIFKTDSATGMEIVGEPVLTPYNYGSITNILATKVKIIKSGANYEIRSLGDFGTDIEITGYNPYATGRQEVTVSYGDLSTNFAVTNPTSWSSGWDYYTVEEYIEDGNIERERIYLKAYHDHDLDIKTLYFPETIDGHRIEGIGGEGCLFGDDNPDLCARTGSNDAKNYETFVLPESIVAIGRSGLLGDNGGYTYAGKRLQNLHRIVSLAPELSIYDSGVANLVNLTELDAKITFAEVFVSVGDSAWRVDGFGAFQNDKYLAGVVLSNNTKYVPRVAFGNCRALTHIDIPNSVTQINMEAFRGAGLETINLNHVKTVGEMAFVENANLREVYIPATLTSIQGNVFAGARNLMSVVVSPDNTVYDSRENSNAIIETSSNKLITGSNSTTIPASIKAIGQNAFYSLSREQIVVPEGVETIESGAFSGMAYLSKVVLPRSLESFDEYAFFASWDAILWVYDNTYAKERAVELWLPYILMDSGSENPEQGIKIISRYELPQLYDGYKYKAFEQLTPENFTIKVFYKDGTTGEEFSEPEIITDYYVLYNDGRSEYLLGGYNVVTILFDTDEGYTNINFGAEIIAEQLMPKYEIPTGLSAYAGDPITEIALPEGFYWVDDEEFIDESKTEYLVNYVPEDARNYKTIRNIPVHIEVLVGTTFAEIFPDANLRTCILNTLNSTEEMVNLDDVYGLTSLTCHPQNEAEKIVVTRGLEKMTNLTYLYLSGNSISNINLKKNTALETLILGNNNIEVVDVSNSPRLTKLLVDTTLVKTNAFPQWVGLDDGEEEVFMDVSALEFLKNGSFSVEGAVYDQETDRIVLSSDLIYDLRTTNLNKIKVVQSLSTGETTMYYLYCPSREILTTVYLDGMLVDEKASTLRRFFTGEELVNRRIIQSLTSIYEFINSSTLEDIKFADINSDSFTVGQSDVEVIMYFKNLRDANPTPIDPDQPDNPSEDDPEDGPKVPNTGISILGNLGTYQPLAALVPIAVFFAVFFVYKSRKQKNSREHGIR